jgi:hypothetical protein
MRFKILYGLAAVGLVGAAAWSLAPSYVRWQIHKRHPEVSFDALDVGLHAVTLHHVAVDKGWIKVQADTAIVTVKTEAVQLQHGMATVDLDKRSEHTGGSEHQDITASGFVVQVHKGQTTADLKNVSVSREQVCFEDAAVVDPRVGTVTVKKGCAARDLSTVTLDFVDLAGGLPKINASAISVEHVEVHPKDSNATFQYASVYAMLGGKEAMIIASGNAELDAKDIHLKLALLTVRHPWLANEPVTWTDVEATVPRDLKSPSMERVGAAHILVDPGALQVSGDEPCQAWAEALPPQLRSGPLATPDFMGNLSFEVKLKPPSVKMKSTCKSACTSPALQALRKVFTYTAYDEHGRPFPRVTGPDLRGPVDGKGWTNLSDISATLPALVEQLEDPGFRGHHGFIANALENSLIADVKAGKFSRGGSTITMQLAKNVWLARDKTFGRKIQELLLSTELESCFSKDTILETYLNVVEFGPNIYGVDQAAAHYFGVDPIALDPRESLYLAWVLPRPRKAPPPNEKTMGRMTNLLQMLAGQGRIPDAMLVDAENAEAADTSDWVAAP